VTNVIRIETKEIVAPIHAAQRIGVTKRRLVQMAEEKKIPAIVDSRGHRTFRAEDVDRVAGERQQRREQKAAGVK
jgi:excisionase family DNA binding protein